ncbi:MAG: NADH-quinone oxidoreductase subunit K, partial [Geminicoccaceae bacterium]
LIYGAPPLIAEGMTAPAVPVANPLPQALILTAIVIGFGLVAFTLVLALRAYQELGTVNVDAMNLAEATASSDDKKADIVALRDAA